MSSRKSTILLMSSIKHIQGRKKQQISPSPSMPKRIVAGKKGHVASLLQKKVQETIDGEQKRSKPRLAKISAHGEVFLPESEHQYQALFDVIPVAVYICDMLGVIQKYNRHAAQLWGREPKIGETDTRFCGSLHSSVLTAALCLMHNAPWPKYCMARYRQ